MKTFVYKAVREPGETVNGEIEAEELASAATALLNKGYHVLDIEDAAEVGGASRLRFHFGFLSGFRRRDLVRFTRDLAALLRAGLPLVQSLAKLRARETRPGWRNLTAGIQAALEDGQTFSQSLGLYSGIFDAMYVNLVRAGEEGGTLSETLTHLADLGEQRDEIRAKVKLALVYPIVMLAIGAVTVAVLLTVVVPMFTEVFKETGQTLPLPTQVLVGLSGFLKAWWWIVLPAVAVATGLALRFSNTPAGKRIRATLALSLPEIRKVAAMAEITSFARTLGTLLHNGVPMVRALEVTTHTLQNHHFQKEAATLRAAVHDGEALSKALADASRFPDNVASIVAVGEDSGTLPDALLQIADDYDRDLERELKILTTLIEPAMIVLVGAVVGFIVMAIVLPIFELGNVVQP